MDDVAVSDLMTTPVLTLDASTSIADAADGMLQSDIKSVLVIDEECTPRGILTSTDILGVTADADDPTEITVSDEMTTDIHTVTEDTPIVTVAGKMREYNINHMPVVDETETVVGMLTQTDITTHLADTA